MVSSVIIYATWVEMARRFSPQERLDFYDALFDFAFYSDASKAETLSDDLYRALAPIAEIIQKNNAKYLASKEEKERRKRR